MISLPSGTRIWPVAGVTDRRKSFNGLGEQVQHVLNDNPFSGHLFIFRGRRGDTVKILWADADGLCLFTKRQEEGQFLLTTSIPGMSSSLPDDISALKRLLAEQEALNRALQEKLNEREREIDHLQAQLDKLRRMNFGSRSEKVSRRIAQMEADLKALQKESDTLTGRVDDPAVQRPLRQTRTRKPFPESL